MEDKYRELKAAVEAVSAVDAHAHNLVDIHSSFPFLRCFSEAEGDALPFATHTLSFKVSFSFLNSSFAFPLRSISVGCSIQWSFIQLQISLFGSLCSMTF